MVLRQISEFLNQKIEQGVTDLTIIEDDLLGVAEFPVAVLFVDISGFTALNEKYARQEGGIEIVTKHINGYFSKLIALIESKGGDILKFAGDALIVAFGNQYEAVSLETLTLRATSCGLEIQDKLKTYNADGITLFLHIAVACGDLYTFHLGGVNDYFEFFPSGAVFTQVSSALDKSQAGQLYLSKVAYMKIKDRVVATENDGDFWVTSIIDEFNFAGDFNEVSSDIELLSLPFIRRYIDKNVLDRIDAGQSSWLAEYRRVSVLFVNLQGLSFQKSVGQDDDVYHPPDFDQLNEVLQVCQKCIFRHEGFVRQFLVDDKGCTLIAIFGAPKSTPNDAILAVSTALAIKNQLKTLKLKTYMGVTTGLTFCGTVGSQARQEYAVVGDIVNLSARLMVASKTGGHGILCDQPTFDVAGKRFNMESLPPIKVKGKEDTINIYIPRKAVIQTGASHKISESLSSSEAFGRSGEVALLYESLEEISSQFPNHSCGFFLYGVSGIGKSVITSKFIAMAHAKFKGRVYVSSGDSIDQATPFLVFSNILSQAMQFGEDAKTNENLLRSRVFALQDEEERNQILLHLPLLNDLLKLDLAHNSATLALSSEFTEERRLEIVSSMCFKLLVAISEEGPSAIVIDDAAVIDKHSWGLLVDICSTSNNIVIFTSSDVKNKHVQMEQFEKLFNVTFLPLQPLDLLSIQKVVYQSQGLHDRDADKMPKAIVDILDEKAQGNPLFARELIKQLIKCRTIDVDKENNIFKVLEEIKMSIPTNLSSLVVASVDLLDPIQQMVLKIASVMGKSCSCTVLEAVFPEEMLESQQIVVQDVLDALVRAGFLLRNEKENKYVFISNMFQEVAYNMLLSDQRKELHKATSKYYEDLFFQTDQLSPVYKFLVHHFQCAGKEYMLILLGLSDKVSEYQQRFLARKRWMNAYRLACAVSSFQKSKSSSPDEPLQTPKSPRTMHSDLRSSKLVKPRDSGAEKKKRLMVNRKKRLSKSKDLDSDNEQDQSKEKAVKENVTENTNNNNNK